MFHSLEQFRRDVRFGARGLARTPAFTSLAALSLALGIMATTAIYSVLYAVVLDPFPYRDVDSLMSVAVANAECRGYRTGYPVDHFLEIAERTTIFDGVIASTIRDVLWSGDGDRAADGVMRAVFRLMMAVAASPRHAADTTWQDVRRDGQIGAGGLQDRGDARRV